MLIYIALFGGAAFGVLIAYLIIVERELKEKSRRLAELATRAGSALELTDRQQASEEQEQPTLPGLNTSSELVGLKDDNARLLSEIAVLKDDRVANQEKIRSLESSREKQPEFERQLAALKEDNSRLLEQVADLARERDAGRARIKEMENSQGRYSEMESRLAGIKEENSRLSAQIADLRSMILEKIEFQLAGLNGLYHEVEASAKLMGPSTMGASESRTRS